MGRLIAKLISFEWVVITCEDGQELAVRLFGCIIIGYYKGDIYFPTNIRDIRAPEKREFGESVHQI